ncbi:MAG: hypothetical protein WBH03_18905, partial [Cyclobacteriaceae bacterium]
MNAGREQVRSGWQFIWHTQKTAFIYLYIRVFCLRKSNDLTQKSVLLHAENPKKTDSKYRVPDYLSG